MPSCPTTLKSISGSMGVSGLAGLLDGEWTNPTSLSQLTSSIWPSGNGTAGGDFTFYVTFLPGDATGNGSDAPNNIIELQELLNVKNNFGSRPPPGFKATPMAIDRCSARPAEREELFRHRFHALAQHGGGMMMMSPSGGGRIGNASKRFVRFWTTPSAT